MFTFKHVVVFFILQNTVFSYYFPSEDWYSYEYYDEKTDEYYDSLFSDEITDEYYDSLFSDELTDEYYDSSFSDEITDESCESSFSDETSDSESERRDQLCPEKDQSLISQSDVQYLIEKKVKTLKIEEKINSSYLKAQEIYDKHMGELKEFLIYFENSPEHLLHVLELMAILRLKLEPVVEEIASKLEEQSKYENAYHEAENRSVNMLKQLEDYKQMCEMNCGNHSIQNRFGMEINYNSWTAEMVCVRLKDLDYYIYKKISEIQPQFEEDIIHFFENIDKKIEGFKNNLREAAIKQFGTTMIKVFRIQDDYLHLSKDFNHANISLDIDNLKENIDEIETRLIGLKQHLEKFRQHCMNCSTNERIKRSVFGSLDDSRVVEANIMYGNTDMVNELINATINEIKETIKNHMTTMFKELDELIDDPKTIDSYVSRLHPIQDEIESKIETEQEALNTLRKSIPQASADKILALLKESKQKIQILESAKQFIEQFIPTI